MALQQTGSFIFADRDPTVLDDFTSEIGAVRGYQWINTDTGDVFMCRSGTEGAAVWSGVAALTVQHNSEASAPTVDDDETQGYSVGSLWQDTDANRVYVLANPAEGAAVWGILPDGTELRDDSFTGTHLGMLFRAGEGTYVAVRYNAASGAPTVNDDSTQGYTLFSRWIDTDGPDIYECVSAAEGAADWRLVYSAP